MKIYVVTHKPCENPIPKDYEYIQVGAEGKEHFCPLTDDLGSDHISSLNYKYCELTALYWIWKNDNQNDIVGLAHYRRFFTKNRFSSSVSSYLSAADADKLLSSADLVVTKPYKTAVPIREHFGESVQGKDFDVLISVMSRLFPDYLPTLEAVLASKETYLLNMFIGRKRFVDDYCQWLFPILAEVDKAVDMTSYSPQQKRLLGYLSEFLFTVYIKHHNLNVVSKSVHIVGLSKTRQIFDKVQRLVKHYVK